MGELGLMLLYQCYWSMLDGNGAHGWADPILTDLGVAEAETARDA